MLLGVVGRSCWLVGCAQCAVRAAEHGVLAVPERNGLAGMQCLWQPVGLWQEPGDGSRCVL